jgi:DNA polymerase phi
VLVRNGAVPKDDDCVQQILSFFAAHGFFELKKAKKSIKSLEVSLDRFRCMGTAHSIPQILPQPAFTAELRGACRARFLSCLSELADQTTLLSDVDCAA